MLHSNNLIKELNFGYMPGGAEDDTSDDDSTDNGDAGSGGKVK